MHVYLLVLDEPAEWPGYVGMTGNLKRREAEHRREFGRTRLSRRYARLSALGYTRSNFRLVPVFTGTRTDCRLVETLLVSYLRLRCTGVANTSTRY